MNTIDLTNINIICNNCLGAEVYRNSYNKYNNPFIWCEIDYQTYKNICLNIDNINFQIVQLIPSQKSPYFNKWSKINDGIKNENRLCVCIDNKYIILFPHYNCFDIIKINHIINNRIKNYSPKKYRKFFILNESENYSKENIKDFLSLNLLNKLALSTYIINNSKHIKREKSTDCALLAKKYILQNFKPLFEIV